MSNQRLFLLLGWILLILLGYAGWLIYLGSYAAMGLGFVLCPTTFVLSLMVGIACGLRRPKPSVSTDDSP